MNNSEKLNLPFLSRLYDDDDFDTSATEGSSAKNASDDFDVKLVNSKLNIYSISLKNPSALRRAKTFILESRRFSSNKTDILKIKTSALPKANSSKAFTYKNTGCHLCCTDETIILNENNDSFVNVGIRYKSRHYYMSNEDYSVPLEVLFAVDDDTFRMFDSYKDVEEKANALEHYKALTPAQKDFFKAQFNRPVIGDGENDSVYTPIKNAESLRVLYNACKYTYSASTRAKIEFLFAELKNSSAFKSEHADIVNQLSHILCTDTSAKASPERTFDEIIEIMNKYIYGLEEFKESFAEFLLSMQSSKSPNFAALFIGPPGVGKTSIAEIISVCSNKPLVQIDCAGANKVSMAGLFRSYEGAKAGKVADGLWELGSANTVVLLDEIDKLAIDKDGNPYSAILKALGPQKMLYDEYVDADIDVSSTIFIASANCESDIPQYVINRFGNNVFRLDAYSAEEKAAIAMNYSTKKILDEHNLSSKELVFSEKALELLAKEYCEDEGMREMEGYIRTLTRKAFRIWNGSKKRKKITVDEAFVRQHLHLHKNSQTKNKTGF